MGGEDIAFGRAICGDLAQAERREWWIANGRGGYAGGTVAGSLTRVYHGLLLAPLRPPLGRVLVLAKADAWLIDGSPPDEGRRWPLFTNRWASGAVAPAGHVHIEHFSLDGAIPVWRYAFGDRVIEHAIWLEPAADTVYAAWRLRTGGPARLNVTLLANHRDHHGGDEAFTPDIVAQGGVLDIRHRGTRLRITAPGGSMTPACAWFEDFFLPVEAERGLAATTRHLQVGTADIPLTPNAWCGIVATLGEADTDLAAALERRRRHDRAVVARAKIPHAPRWITRLLLAADSFVFARKLPGLPDGTSIIAGYPWFGDWGRDSMIALPGLLLATGRAEEAKRLLRTFARFVDHGQLPNLFPGDGEEPAYNTVDATLWFFVATRLTIEATGDDGLLRELYPVLAGIIAWHVGGTRHGIRVDPADGLLGAGAPGTQLTWMDARVDGVEITPRIGKPVEVNALWFNALRAMVLFADRLGVDGRTYAARADAARRGFARFLRPDGSLFDVLDPDDPTRRPNQILVLSLPECPLDPASYRGVLDACGPLLCSAGLRSLAPGDPRYHGGMTGPLAARDGAYHQGTVWAWLLGHYALAHARMHGDPVAAQAWLAPLADHLHDAGLGTISEVFDGDPPHTPRGCPAQAWSVGCTIEAWWRLERMKETP